MTPNFGQGANSAIEDSAAMANLLHDMITTQSVKKPNQRQISCLLRQFQSQRFYRVQNIYKVSRFLVRFQARDGLLNIFLGRYCVPYAADLPADIASSCIAGAVTLNYIPIPTNCGTGWNRNSDIFTAYRQVALASVCVLILAVAVLA